MVVFSPSVDTGLFVTRLLLHCIKLNKPLWYKNRLKTTLFSGVYLPKLPACLKIIFNRMGYKVSVGIGQTFTKIQAFHVPQCKRQNNLNKINKKIQITGG